MKIGEINRNGQSLLKITVKKSTTHPYANIWVMKCIHCGNEYGCNSCDAHIRKCPNCDKSAAAPEPIPGSTAMHLKI